MFEHTLAIIEKLEKENKQLKKLLKELEVDYNEELYECPKCGSKYWGRPYRDDIKDHDFTKRRCSNCKYENNEPEW